MKLDAAVLSSIGGVSCASAVLAIAAIPLFFAGAFLEIIVPHGMTHSIWRMLAFLALLLGTLSLSFNFGLYIGKNIYRKLSPQGFISIAFSPTKMSAGFLLIAYGVTFLLLTAVWLIEAIRYEPSSLTMKNIVINFAAPAIIEVALVIFGSWSFEKDKPDSPAI